MTDPTPPPPKSKWRRRLLELAVFLAVFLAIRAWQRRGVADGDAPRLDGVTIEGEHFQLTGAEGPTLVHFWATWCGVCKAMDGNVVAVARDARVITVAASSGSPERVRAAMVEEGLTEGERLAFPVIADPDGRLAAAWGVGAYPTSFIVDADGTIRSVEVGYTTELGLRARLSMAE